MLHSIMANPQLAKSFGDAFSAPMGSTKRDQGRTMFSIMKKLGGIRNDGQGGPLNGYLGVGTDSSKLTVSPFTDYSNMMIFPSAPKLKGSFEGMKLPTPKDTSSVAGGTSTPQTTTGLLGSNLNTTTWGNQWNNVSNKLSKDISGMANFQQSTTSAPFSNLSLANLPAPTVKGSIPGLTGSGVYQDVLQPGWTPYTSPEAQADALKNKNAGKTPAPTKGLGPYYPGTSADITGADTTGTSIDISEPKPTGIRAQAQKAVTEGIGAGFFAKNIVDEKFGGSLDAYMNNFDEKLKTDFNLTGLETELSNLKAQKQNLIPTMQNYIRGKDKYLSFIDKMIEKTEGTLMSRDMGNPAVEASYNKYMNYLYTLKGRQNQRYGNFLNSAIADYNADVERTTSNYENVYKKYSDTMTRQIGIATTEYNALYTAMADLYKNIEEAPTKSENLKALQLENIKREAELTKTLISQANATDPEYYKKKDVVFKSITDKDGNFSPEVVGAGGLAGIFSKSGYAEGNINSTADAINVAMANAILNKPDDMTQIKDFRDMLASLTTIDGGSDIASMISPSLALSAKKPVSNYIQNNMSRIKAAVKNLVKGKNPDQWFSDFSDIDPEILRDIYDLTTNSLSAEKYANNPDSFMTDFFAGNSNQDIADRVASYLTSSW